MTEEREIIYDSKWEALVNDFAVGVDSHLQVRDVCNKQHRKIFI